MAKSTKTNYLDMMEEWFSKLPPLPKGGKEGIVTVTPWISLIFGILGILASLGGLGLLTAFSPLVLMGGGLNGAFGSILAALLGLIASILLLAAFPGTKSHKMKGWQMLFWSEGVNLIAAVVSVSITGIIVSLIVFYLLFQIKSYYK